MIRLFLRFFRPRRAGFTKLEPRRPFAEEANRVQYRAWETGRSALRRLGR